MSAVKDIVKPMKSEKQKQRILKESTEGKWNTQSDDDDDGYGDDDNI